MSAEIGPDSEKDEKLKRKFSVISDSPETAPEKTDDEVELAEEEPKKQSWLEKLFQGKNSTEKQPDKTVESPILPAMEVELVAESPEAEVSTPEATAEELERQLNLQREDQIRNEEISETSIVVEQDEKTESIPEVSIPEQIEKPEDSPEIENTEIISQEPENLVETIDEPEAVDLKPARQVEKQSESKPSDDQELEIRDNIAKPVVVAIQDTPTDNLVAKNELDKDQLAEAYKSAIETEDEPKDIEQAATELTSKLTKRIGQLKTNQEVQTRAESADLQKSVIAVSEKILADPNKSHAQQRVQVKNLMEVLGFENVDQTLDLLIKQYGEQFISQLMSQLLMILRQEKYELDPIAIRKARKKLQTKIRMSIGHCAIKLSMQDS
ncbi:hypothetical protein KBB17_00220 [Candidatus Saccharibacteria bacterium]|nr:hypothetical protein [Candidatus Saccharibacteria bacterium]MBP9131702.1 hypothetical protein [Candidatus Saccharibacteria bacterium]